ncbi:Predicted ABC transporter, ATPase component [Clostridium kluyveri DSM 555]|uniref:Predicted ABC transporter, ATPase component n=1 Tax=Clostridium kluyveri (strain ATCC 8527 / DSM 555 / NBRC 12016 / NCIMB 10680 / K1) TaxID=431943 RepID=A5N5J6_CLOK5|nr:Predicted ABC transporter, ATPase component [Clostridium kluyveri DSM 555]
MLSDKKVIENDDKSTVNKITVIGGYDKQGKPENITLDLNVGQIISIVGPTGSGKSRLLADIEYMAQKDTPTGRQILINDKVPDISNRFSSEGKLVAQLSQNMNFVMDVTVGEFLTMHSKCRKNYGSEEIVDSIIKKANELSGEKFSYYTPLTALSGGQSRALMIADTAYLSTSPIVLIDEIENAGIDRKKALDALIKKEKIVLMATHDPILILMSIKRIIIKNGGISKVIFTSPEEKKVLESLQSMDNKISSLRNLLRNGDIVESISS